MTYSYKTAKKEKMKISLYRGEMEGFILYIDKASFFFTKEQLQELNRKADSFLLETSARNSSPAESNSPKA